ncbi:MAG TPA: hypothetical protein VNQ79_08940 [Blastocatellia bacterium]|nr:hypothetical protein [Blastocatellia bacterium]
MWELLAGQQPLEFLTVELPSVKMRKPDFLARLGKKAIFHLELQGDNLADMEWRELEYYQMIYRLLNQPPLQVVLYFGAEPLAMKDYIAFESLQFQYTLIDIRAIRSDYLLQSRSLNDHFFAVLADAGETGSRKSSEESPAG